MLLSSDQVADDTAVKLRRMAIREARKDAGIGVLEMAGALGVCRQRIHQIEHADMLRLSMVLSIAKLCRTNPAMLLRAK